MILYDYYRSSASFRVRIALNLKGASYESVPISLVDNDQRSEAHLARNPQGLVPALEVDGVVLTQSLAIIDWLDSRFPEPRLIPTEPLDRARALALSQIVATDIHPLNNLRVQRRLSSMGVSDEARSDWVAHWITEGFDALEKMAGEMPFLGGDAPNIADIYLIPQIYNARRVDLSLDPYPRLRAIESAALALPAFADAHPSKHAPA